MPFELKFENLAFLNLGAATLVCFVTLYASVLIFKKVRVDFISLLTKMLVAFLLICSLAGPYLETKTESSKAIALVDISESNDEEVMQELLLNIEKYAANGIDISIIPFSAEVGSKSNALPASYRLLKTNNAKLDLGKTNLENAIKSLQGSDSGSVLLLSDGFETQASVVESIPALQSKGYKVFPLLPENAETQARRFAISNMYAPLVAASEKSVDVRVSLLNTTQTEQAAILEISHDGKSIFSRRLAVGAGREEVFTAKSDPSKEGIKEITAVLRPDDKFLSPSSETIYLSGESREKLLLLSGSMDDQRFLKEVLDSQAYQVKSFVGASTDSLDELSTYSVLILNNVAISQLPRGADATIEEYVKSGGAFIMLGGNKSFGLGGYISSKIEDVLPVSLVPPQTVEKRLNLAVQLVLDKSKSMAEGNRIDFAKEAAVKIVDNLKDEDYIGVLGFDTNPFVVIRLARVADVRDEAERRINLLYPNKGTSLVASLDEARRDLLRVNAGRKHMLVLTDGEITDAPKQYYYELVKQIRLLGITVSTVMLGSEGDESMLKQMADIGGGAFYVTANARSLPQIFIADLKVASGERTMKEQDEYSVRVGPSDLKSTSVSSYPTIRGYVQTKIKPKADLELLAVADNKAEPLLASWGYGKGKSMAFTSDANGRWSASWINWPRFQQFWSELIDSLRSENKDEQEKVKFDLRTYYEQGVLKLDLAVFSSEQGGLPEAELQTPSGERKKLSFKAAAPGHYLAEIKDPKPGRYEFHAKVGAAQLTPVAFKLSGELFGEKKGQGFNLALLRNIAAATSGKINPSLQELKGQVYVQNTSKDLTPLLMLSALVLFVLEILWREVFRSLLLSKRTLFKATI